MHWIKNIPTPIIFGHRGDSINFPENTMAAFKSVIEKGGNAFELDTMLSADGIPVVIHDRGLGRTTKINGNVDDFSALFLHNFDAGSYFSSKFSKEKIPLLSEVLSEFKDKALINIELKNFHAPFDKLPKIVAEMVLEYGMANQVIFSSFLPLSIFRIRKYLPEAKTAILCGPGLIGKILCRKCCLKISPEIVHPHFSIVSETYLEKSINRARMVNCWTVDDFDQVAVLIKRGITGIITNDPHGVRSHLLTKA